ncbi:MAG: Holliday junction resolvase RuvX [Planctomycetes bacterium]|nr:Holliday junction resolvase RuvX [Planctomycetota bacterium]
MPAAFVRRLVTAALVLLVPMSAAHARQEAAAPTKMPVAIGAVKVTPALSATLVQRGQALELGRVQESLDSQLISAFQQTRKFDVIARSDLKDVVLEQDLGTSGNVDRADPNAAKTFRVAGAKFVVVSTIDDFQDNVQEAEFKEIGKKATRRQVRLSMVTKVYDTTSGRLLESANLQLDNSAFVRNPEFLVGEKGSNLTEKALQEMARVMAEKAAMRVTDVLLPAKVLAVRDGSVTLNRGDGTGVAVGNRLLCQASPQGHLQAQGDARWPLIARCIQDWQPDALVVGVPFHPDGAEHENTHRARRFARQLLGRYGLPVFEVDERYSTTEAMARADINTPGTPAPGCVLAPTM